MKRGSNTGDWRANYLVPEPHHRWDQIVESFLAILVGVGLAASCGFRVFVPMLVASVAARAGYLELSEGFAWIGSWPALLAFAAATVLEIGAYYIPWLDNALDALTSPASVVAGTVMFAAFAVDFDPLLQWSLAAIVGGGSAGVVQAGTVSTRAASTASTGGLANFAVNTLESLAGFFFSVMAIVWPLLAVLLLLAVVAGLYYAGRKVLRRFFSREPKAAV